MDRSRVLLVGGVDSSAGAGLDVDREGCRELEVDGIEIPTAHTEQDAHGVQAIEEVEPAAWLADALTHGPSAAALKFGLLPGVDHMSAAAALVRELCRADLGFPVVLDPVIASSSGRRFLDDPALAVLRDSLLSAGPIVTPNLGEAAELTGQPLAPLTSDPGTRVRAAGLLLELGARAVLIKGGHGDEDPVRDLLLIPGRAPIWLEHPRVPRRLRGTGCRFASALAGLLARGRDLEQAALIAGRYVSRRICEAGEARG